MKLILIKNTGDVTSVDDEKYEYLNQFTWHLTTHGYVARTLHNPERTVFMHHEVMETKELVDHRDGCKINNLKANLRLATFQQNLWNQKTRSNSLSKVKGVRFIERLGKWQARICIDYKSINLGLFLTVEEAKAAYDKKAVELFGEFARVE